MRLTDSAEAFCGSGGRVIGPSRVNHVKGFPIVDVYARAGNGCNGISLPILHCTHAGCPIGGLGSVWTGENRRPSNPILPLSSPLVIRSDW
jgi:hypothetical protein